MGDVVDLNDARERLRSTGFKHPIVDALDTLAVALAEHGHTWTDSERWKYETAIMYLMAGRPT